MPALPCHHAALREAVLLPEALMFAKASPGPAERHRHNTSAPQRTTESRAALLGLTAPRRSPAPERTEAGSRLHKRKEGRGCKAAVPVLGPRFKDSHIDRLRLPQLWPKDTGWEQGCSLPWLPPTAARPPRAPRRSLHPTRLQLRTMPSE